MKKLVFLLEEPSMKEFLDAFLPRLLPGQDFLCVKHEGKQDLEKSIPRKLRAWRGVDFVVVRDNDNGPCRKIKARLRFLCKKGGRPETLVRLACQELETWYLGAMATIASEYSRKYLLNVDQKAKFRDPDKLGNPTQLLSELLPEFRKIDGARRMGRAIPAKHDGSRSKSFQVFVDGVRKLAVTVGSEPIGSKARKRTKPRQSRES